MLTFLKKEIETAENTSPNWVLTNIQTQTALGSPMTQYIWRPSWEKVPGSASSLQVRLQKLQFRLQLIIPGCRQISTSICEQIALSQFSSVSAVYDSLQAHGLQLWVHVNAVCFIL